MTRPTVGSQSSWTTRLFWLDCPPRSRPGASHDHSEFPPFVRSRRRKLSGPTGTGPSEDISAMTKRLINDDRYAFVLLKEAVDQISDRDAQPAWSLLDKQMR